jgi:hypothetical protein
VSAESRKEKKKRIMDRNKRHNLINLMAWQHEGVGEHGGISAPEFNPEKSRDYERRKQREEEVVWSEKVAFVRNRITGKKRASKERWNRFAGTSGGGGRGL